MSKPQPAKLRLKPWSLDESLQTEEDIAHYLDAVIEDGDVDLLLDALGVIARKRGMTDVAKRAGLGRESLYRALSAKGDPQLSTLVKVLGALGLRLRFAAA